MRSAERRVQSAECRVQSTECRKAETQKTNVGLLADAVPAFPGPALAQQVGRSTCGRLAQDAPAILEILAVNVAHWRTPSRCRHEMSRSHVTVSGSSSNFSSNSSPA